MCIRDRYHTKDALTGIRECEDNLNNNAIFLFQEQNYNEGFPYFCLLYTSDAADERSSVDLGGRRIIKKKKRQKIRGHDDMK